MIDRRADPEEREWLERLLTQAAKKGGEEGAIIALSRFSPHDLTTHDGQKAFQADNDFVHQTRVRCEKVRDKAWLYGGLGFIGIAVIAFFDRITVALKGVLS